jgi:membrane protein DedA with SNARE-associated domain
MHFPTDFIVDLLRTHGLLFLFPLAIFEGPIVSVVAGWLIRLGYMQFGWVYAVCVVADLVGDTILYWIGSCSNGNWSRRYFPRIFNRVDKFSLALEQFHTRGGRILILAKLTHSLGFAALMAAGAARMSFPAFLWYNFLATLPKTLFFLLIGYGIGEAYSAIDTWIWRASVLLFVIASMVALFWLNKLRVKPT